MTSRPNSNRYPRVSKKQTVSAASVWLRKPQIVNRHAFRPWSRKPHAAQPKRPLGHEQRRKKPPGVSPKQMLRSIAPLKQRCSSQSVKSRRQHVKKLMKHAGCNHNQCVRWRQYSDLTLRRKSALSLRRLKKRLGLQSMNFRTAYVLMVCLRHLILKQSQK